jgi:hypothetical protein
LAENLDLLVKHQITAIRQVSTAIAEPQLRFGLWHLPVSFSLPRTAGWFTSNVAAAKRALAKTIANAGVFHLAIDAGRLAEGDPAKLGEVERILDHAAELRAAQQLEVLSLHQLAERLDRPSDGAPLRSILRAA